MHDVGETPADPQLHLQGMPSRLQEPARVPADPLSASNEVAAREAAETALRTTLAQLQTLFTGLPLALVILGPDRRVQTWNPEAERLFGWSAAEAIGQPLPTVPEDKQDEFQRLHEAALHGARHNGIELCRRRKDGSFVHVTLWTVPLLEDDGGVAGAIGLYADISDRKGAEAALGERTRQLEAVVRATRSVTSGLDLEGILDRILEEASAMAGTDDVRVILTDREAEVLRVVRVKGQLVPVGYEYPLREGLSGLVITSGEPVFSADAPSDPRTYFGSRYRTLGIVTYLGLPIKTGNQAFGVLVFNTSTPHHYSREEMAYLTAFADQAALAIENARLFATTQRELAERKQAEGALALRTRHLEALRVVSQEIARELDLTRLLQLLIARAAELVGASSGTVYLVEDDHAVPAAWHGLGDWQGAIRLPLGEGVAGAVAHTRQGVLVNDYRTSRYANPVSLQRTQITASLGEPLLYRNEAIGAVTLNHEGGRTFTTDDQGLLRLFASQAAIAIQNARLHAMALAHTRQFATVTELTQTLTTLRDPSAVAEEIVKAVSVLHPRTIVQLWRWDQEAEVLRLVAAAGVPLATHPLRLLKPGEGLAGHAFAERAPVLSGDVATDRRFAATAWAAAERFSVAVALPLLYQAQAHGAFVLLWREPHEVTDQELDALRAFAAHATIGLENARLFRGEQRRREELEAVRGVTEEMARELDLDALLRLIQGRAMELCRGDLGAIYLWDEVAGVLVPKNWYGFGDWLADLRLKLGDGVAGTVAARRRGMLVNDFRNSPYTYPAFVERSSHVAVLGEPLLYRSRLVGVLIIARNDPARPFVLEDQRLLQLFATQAAIAVENARLFQEQQQAYVKLQEAQGELVRTEKLRALGQMGAGIAHDLNNMLAAVLGQAELLKLHVSDPDGRRSLQTLTTAATDGAVVVRRLQDFSRQRGKAPVVSLHLSALVKEVLEITRPRWADDMQRLGLSIEVTTDLADLPPVLGHAPELREALTNLILNSVDAMPRGGQLRLVGRAATPEWVDLQITDTGVGIPEAIRPHIFDPFFTTKGPQGTGLGLSVVYAIVERHSGRIEVTSAPGHGTTFTLRLRRATADPARPGPVQAAPSSACRILVIDDDPLVRETVGTLLRTAGHTVTEAAGGAEAVERLGQEPLDLVLTDLGMPGLTGWDVAREVKARYPDLPVILLTGWGEQAACDHEGGRPTQVDLILSKPVTLEELLRAVAKLTSRKKPGRDTVTREGKAKGR